MVEHITYTVKNDDGSTRLVVETPEYRQSHYHNTIEEMLEEIKIIREREELAEQNKIAEIMANRRANGTDQEEIETAEV